MIAEINAPRFRYVASPPPLTNCQPRPGPLTPPWADAMSGLMMLSVNALTRLLNAKATTSPTATTITSPRIRKFLKPVSMAIPPHRWTCRHNTRQAQHEFRTNMLSLPLPALESIGGHGGIANCTLDVTMTWPTAQRTLHGAWRRCVSPRLQARARRHCVEEARLTLSVGALAALG